MSNSPHDEHWMQQAIMLGQWGAGKTGPNPSVGAVLVKDGRVIAKARTANGGRPHAEAVLLESLPFGAAQGATLYVTLEPCCHYGQTPPCVDLIVRHAIGRVVIGIRDENPLIQGGGMAQLESRGIPVIYGVLAEQVRWLHRGFCTRMQYKRPYVTAKIATSLDGAIALANGQSKWITGDNARKFGHYLRAENDVIMVGIGTVLADNPSLDCRIAGLEEFSPQRLIIDRNLRIPLDCQLVQKAARYPTFLATRCQHHDPTQIQKSKQLIDQSVRLIRLASLDDETYNPNHVWQELLHCAAENEWNHLFIEGGTKVITSAWQSGVIDSLWWFRAPIVLGHDALPAINVLGFQELTSISRWQLIEQQYFDHDCAEHYISYNQIP
jgi:diaminohydroxyphosphoribosylaminopyrimidine deaminase/5-amino-6-(5-phosphoribosylamino)uracil reductase